MCILKPDGFMLFELQPCNPTGIVNNNEWESWRFLRDTFLYYYIVFTCHALCKCKLYELTGLLVLQL